jgi:BirA family transcriptional regulator, biotin operon repressor / biotin---[acetyl-CoA-carboxylase] ligase
LREGDALTHNGCIRKPRSQAIASDPQRALDERLRQIIGVLTEHATMVVSGTKISQEIGASRSAIWRMVQQLRSHGVAIEGHPTTGYLLKEVPDLALPEVIDPLIAGTIFTGHLHHFFKTDSTNAQAMRAASEGAPEGSVYLAEEQVTGRGRGGHGWHSAKGTGIYCSVVLRPAVAPADVLVLSLAAGLAVHEAVERITGLRADLRWPNDLLLNGKKFCGILAEMNAEPTRVRYVVTGFGINVNQTEFPEDLQESATSLRMARGAGQPGSAVAPWPRVELVAALLQSLDRECRNLQEKRAVIQRFSEQSSCCKGTFVRVEEQGGGYEGITEGLDETGFLKVRTPDGLRIVLSGGVRPLNKD